VDIFIYIYMLCTDVVATRSFFREGSLFFLIFESPSHPSLSRVFFQIIERRKSMEKEVC